MMDEHCGSLFLRRLPSSDLRRMEPYLELRAFAREEVVQNDGDLIRSVTFPHDMTVSLLSTYGIRAFDSAGRAVAIVKPRLMVANCAHPALIVLGPGGL